MTTRTPLSPATTSTLDYYLLHAEADSTRAEALLVEEFVLADDLTAVGLRSTTWAPGAQGWCSSAAFARAVRTDHRLRARLAAIDRPAAEETYRRLGGGALPDEAALRGHFHDDVALASPGPLRLGTGPDVHRIVFAGEPDHLQLSRLGAQLRLTGAAELETTRVGVVGTGRLRVNDTDVRWELRRIGGGLAWCIDVTAEPADDGALRWLLRQLIRVARGQGLVPATIDRLC